MIIKNSGMLSLTIASTSLKTFQTGYLKHKLILSDRKTNDQMKQAYYGGRTEIFKMFLDSGKYNCYDINSLYPFVMFNNPFPISKPKNIKNPTIKMIKENMGITKAIVTTPKKLYFPVLPYHFLIGSHNKLIFPLGKYIGYWDNSFLKKALELGYNIKPLFTMIFDSDFIFKDYVTKFYKIKNQNEKNTPSYIIAKLMLNSLYGKFAQCQDSEIIKKINDPKDFKEQNITGVFDIDHNLFRVKTESKGNFFLPQISIHVTTLAQLHLYDILEKLYNKGYTTAYCDTDSIFTNAHMNTNSKLGGLKKEFGFYKGYFLLPKTYCVKKNNGENVIKAKGFISKFSEQLEENDFRNALFKNDYSGFIMESDEKKFNTLKTSYVRHNCFVSTDILKRSIRSTYNKRQILKDFDTKPLKIRNI